MVGISTQRWNLLEERSTTLFRIGGLMFIIAAAFDVANILVGLEDLRSGVGQAFIAAGWIAALTGLLGLYPNLADQNRWLAGAGGVFAVIGVVGFVGNGATALVAFVRDVPPTEAFPMFVLVGTIVGVLIGAILGFVSFSIVSLRSDVHSRALSILLLMPALFIITNFFVLSALGVPNPRPSEVTIFILSGLALTMLAIAYVLRTEAAPSDTTEPAPESTVE
ncbi:hypothetical protein HWV23_12875 [Natronomonas halophila]|uniref:hypothetical protein n=1 Tax=Natronomonas halophila TaxID=2747817 RepID=UPI0015B3C71F|nr:hypothetical protein [Natronomonas halophila]QLD86582.1 hypothetical protein HWV23_12875 [Natronomonas halophila]